MNNQIDINNEIKILMNHFNAKQFDFVIQKSLKLVKKFPKVIILYNLLGSSLQNIGNLEGAAEVFNSGLNIQENYVPIMNNLSNIEKKKKMDEIREKKFTQNVRNSLICEINSSEMSKNFIRKN